ncbi:MAG: hypothetical protein FJ088_07475, partial [Deltaproteobacteria bacterium]|nr:hypothetical protein [Deltaproteobacteria bacterium]
PSIPSGELELSFETNGKGRMYATAFLEYFSKEEKIKGSGNEIFVKREYFRLTPTVVKKKTWRGEIDAQDYLKTKIEEGEEIKSGDLIEVKLSVESKNDYEYLVFEDFKAAGFEPVELKSGYIFEHGAHMNMELRDKKVVFFMSGLKQGTQAITYKMRAEIPGKFNALPHKAYAMYAPRVRAISDSNVIDIVP